MKAGCFVVPSVWSRRGLEYLEKRPWTAGEEGEEEDPWDLKLREGLEGGEEARMEKRRWQRRLKGSALALFRRER